MLGRIRKYLVDESGSASVEFVTLAIPLFLPILIFIARFEQLSSSELLAKTIARESLRAYVTATSVDTAPVRAQETLVAVGKIHGLTEEQIKSIFLSFQCSESPCLTPGGRIRAVVRMPVSNQNRNVIAESEEYLSPWQWNGKGKWFNPSFELDIGELDLKLGG